MRDGGGGNGGTGGVTGVGMCMGGPSLLFHDGDGLLCWFLPSPETSARPFICKFSAA